MFAGSSKFEVVPSISFTKTNQKKEQKTSAHETTENIPRDPLLFEIHLITSAKEVSKAQA